MNDLCGAIRRLQEDRSLVVIKIVRKEFEIVSKGPCRIIEIRIAPRTITAAPQDLYQLLHASVQDIEHSYAWQSEQNGGRVPIPAGRAFDVILGSIGADGSIRISSEKLARLVETVHVPKWLSKPHRLYARFIFKAFPNADALHND